MKPPSIRAAVSNPLFLPLALGLAAAGLLLGAARAAGADMAPFPAQEGNSLSAASSTHVQMISETVLIQVADLTNTVQYEVFHQLGARVTADFAMRNPDDKRQLLDVGFPLQVPRQALGAGDYVKIQNLAAFVGGNAVETHLATVGAETWSAWQMSFAPGETDVRITYDLPATADACSAELGYVLHTGAAWADSIGNVDLIVRYPYAAEATFVGPKGIYLGDTTPGYQVEGLDLRWHYDNLEPTVANDLAVTFVAPECWLNVAAARTALNQRATAENYWHLATAYADIVFPHHGFYSPLIAQVAEAQYQRALTLDPENPQINAEFAQFLQAQVGNLLPASRKPDEIQQCIKAMPLAPHDDQLLWACGTFLASQMGDSGVSAAVQATVAAVLTVVPQPTVVTVAPYASETTTPAASPSPAPRPTASRLAIATQTASPEPALMQSPRPPATATPVTVAQITAGASPIPLATPADQPGAGPARTIGLCALVGLILVAGGIYLRRQRRD